MARGGSHFGGGASRGSSHGSRGGSHFGGSSSPRGAGGHANGPSHDPMGPIRPRHRGVFIHIGGHRHYNDDGSYSGTPTPAWAIWIVSAFMLIFLSVPFFILANFCNIALKIIEDDYNYYQNMIAYTDTHSEYIIDATILGKYKNYDVDKWYIEYTLINDGSMLVETGAYATTTYSIFTDEQINNYTVGHTIKVAVDSLPISVTTDSVVMDYRNFSLEDDGEYQQEMGEKIQFNIIGAVFLIIGGACIVMGVVSVIKASKNSTNVEGDSTNTSNTDGNYELNAKKSLYCPYCGCKAEENRKKCEHCGASLK